MIDVYNPNALKELRAKFNLKADKYSQELSQVARGADHKRFFGKVKLEAFCAIKERIGDVDDGGKYACNPRAVRKDNCTLISLGLNNAISYDQHIQNVTVGHCRILGADKDPQNITIQEDYERINGQLFVGMIPNEISITSMLKKAERREVELLKIDIEGGEHEGLEPFIREYRVCQIFIEVHGTPSEHLKIYNFRIFNVEPNPYCFNCCEYSLIQDSCMDQYGVYPLVPIVPKVEF
ncbi:hypothetical protein GCK72_012435 [Caenorhabditis remanei]|uniref:Methyltransferase FkbM domain-containing protein n=1 Tax=Caenorhabditis remanei TaxID=31234 RepID=A0A6A5GNB7_CAERE|nr:hypothetical protein GCK72_012435 [Caenorhabditis remanei]KAF1755982.1 hypothetical protein GCK72_012435 [Caenorhabditis remanei]